MTIDATKLLEQLAQPKMATRAAVSVVPVEPITLERAKQHLRVVFDDEDDYISDLIITAREMAEGKLNRTITQRERTAVFSRWSGDRRLLKPPFVAISEVSYLDDSGTAQILPAGRYYAMPGEPAKLGLVYDGPFPDLAKREDALTVIYVAGYPEGQVPRPIIQWMLLAIGTMYDNRASVVNGVSTQALGDDFAKWLLQPYMVYE